MCGVIVNWQEESVATCYLKGEEQDLQHIQLTGGTVRKHQGERSVKRTVNNGEEEFWWHVVITEDSPLFTDIL